MPYRTPSRLKFNRIEHSRVYNPYDLAQGDQQHVYVVVERGDGKQEFIEIDRPELLKIAQRALAVHADMGLESIKYAGWRREAAK